MTMKYQIIGGAIGLFSAVAIQAIAMGVCAGAGLPFDVPSWVLYLWGGMSTLIGMWVGFMCEPEDKS